MKYGDKSKGPLNVIGKLETLVRSRLWKAEKAARGATGAIKYAPKEIHVVGGSAGKAFCFLHV